VRQGAARLGWARRSRSGLVGSVLVRRGAAGFGGRGSLSFGAARRGESWRSRCGWVWLGAARCGKASHGGQGVVRRGGSGCEEARRSGFGSVRLVAEWLGGSGWVCFGAERHGRVGRSRRDRLGPLSSGMSELGKQRLVQRSVRGIVPLTTNKEGERDVRISEEGTSAHC
jgi:hypothetical protein